MHLRSTRSPATTRPPPPSTAPPIPLSLTPFAAEQPSVGRFKHAKATSAALNTTRALADPGYAYAVLEAYARGKLARGRNKFQVQHKLTALELRMPHFAADFHAVRSNLGLAPSLYLPPTPPPPYAKECSCTCTCGALPGGTVGDAHAATHEHSHSHLHSPADTPVVTPGLYDSPTGPMAGPSSPTPGSPAMPATPGSPSGSDTSLPRALSPTADLVFCALTSGSTPTQTPLNASSAVDVRNSVPANYNANDANGEPTPTPYWQRGGGRNRSLSVQALSARAIPGLALSASASASTTNLGVPMTPSTSAGR